MSKLSPTTRYYEILGISPWASMSEIRQAYREKSKLYHPDTTRLPLALAREKFEQLNEAYGFLNSPQLRQQQSGIAEKQTVNHRSKSNAQYGAWGINAAIRERPLSAGEIFALFILGLTFLGCLVLAVIVGLSRGELIIQAWV